MIDEAKNIRPGEEVDRDRLHEFLSKAPEDFGEILEILQFPGGFSNLTYLIKTDKQEYVLRRPPRGANIKSAHDMGREFNVLSLLYQHYKKVPKPLLYQAEDDIIGAPFYIMERVKGIILRNRPPNNNSLTPQLMQLISEASVANLVKLHQLDIYETGLVNLGKPEGYVERQVTGWIKRYINAETDNIKAAKNIMHWLPENIPDTREVSLIHNDYKYDNLVLNPEKPEEIMAVLDWEMATVGDPLMDLGTTLAYWAEANDDDLLKPFNLTWIPGNLTRDSVVETYFQQRNMAATNVLFYYVFGCFKVAVIVQQIYARYKKGFTDDPRFKHLIHVVKALLTNGEKAIQLNRISHLY
ncbi:phosphotransferase family protein [Fulvivirgaceae bacterium BMA12]|uniref:Phosphotransferase family protein n=1 Tax=Agaribacillus aureus TaxID=3051825 RepID=A0ABT8L721_9BACT|nr:phosphotransferase family protein [Fulvivirgaceae bacterium BMA12]